MISKYEALISHLLLMNYPHKKKNKTKIVNIEPANNRMRGEQQGGSNRKSKTKQLRIKEYAAIEHRPTRLCCMIEAFIIVQAINP